MNGFSAIPTELKSLPNWVLWKTVNGSKVPFTTTGKRASSTDASTWTTFEAVTKNTTISDTQGIGFVINGAAVEQQLVGFDLDNCRDPGTGRVTEWALDLVGLLDSYTEITPSKTGLRVWVTGEFPSDECVFNLDPNAGFGGTKATKIEVFRKDRYFTVSGQSFHNFETETEISPADLRTAHKLCCEIRAKYPKHSPASTKTSASNETGAQVLQSGTAITDKLTLLMKGTIKSEADPFVIENENGARLEYPGRSEADLALCTALAIKHGDNPDAIWDDYTNSSLVRDKWLGREKSFRELTIAKAIKSAEKTNDTVLIGGNPAGTSPTTSSSAREPTSKRLRVLTASNVTTKKIQWLWKHRIPLGKLTIFAGVPGCGKSLITGDIAARLSTGADWFDHQNTFTPSETLMLVGEDDVEDTTVPRLQAAGADLSKIHFLRSVITEGQSSEEREVALDVDMKQVEEFLQTYPNIRLIVVDPVSNYLGSAKMNGDQESRNAVLVPLKSMAERMGVAVIGVMHLNKKVETTAINRVGGSMSFVGVARVAYLFQKSDEDGEASKKHFMVVLKANITKSVDGLVYEIPAKPVSVGGSPEWMPYVHFTGNTTLDAEGVLQPKGEAAGRPPDSRTDAERWLKEFLVDGPKPVKDVFEAGKEIHHFSVSTIRRARENLAIDANQKDRAWVWSLRPDEPSESVPF